MAAPGDRSDGYRTRSENADRINRLVPARTTNGERGRQGGCEVALNAGTKESVGPSRAALIDASLSTYTPGRSGAPPLPSPIAALLG